MESFQYASPSHEAVLGLKQEEIAGRFVRTLIPDHDREHVLGVYYEAVSNKEPFRVVFRKQHAISGTWLYFETYGTPMAGGNSNAINSYLFLSRNITDRHLAEREIKASEEKYRLIAENMSDMIGILDVQGTVRYASPSLLTVMGIHPESFEGQMVFDLIHPEDIASMQQGLFQMIIDKLPRQFTYRVKNANEEWIHIEAKSNPVCNEDEEVEHILLVARDITERIQYEQKLKEMAFTDTLTGLPNRRILLDRAAFALSIAKRDNHSIGLLYLDIDKFKTVNDTMGHDVGDKLLQHFVKRINESLRESDTLCRIGGDEFVVLLPTIANELEAATVAEKMIRSMQSPWTIKKHQLHITSSVGVAISDEEDTVKSLIKKADQALYEAKESGRNTFCIHRAIHRA